MVVRGCLYGQSNCWGTKYLGRWSWDLLGSVVQGVIDRGGIGRPAALRLTVHVRGGEAEARQLQVEAEASNALKGPKCNKLPL